MLIKIIKRKDAEAAADVKTQSALGANQSAPDIEEKIERRSRREIIATISNWISERRKNNRKVIAARTIERQTTMGIR